MQVLNPNNIKIYNLSSGKSLPEWLTDQKKRALQKSNIDIRRRIELIQDFTMPTSSSCVKATPDGRYIFITGIYKPRVRCYDVSQLSMKFERCLDSEIVKFHILSQDYSKIVLLQSDRYIEFHSQSGLHYRTRIPKFGRDLSYHEPSCDMYFVGSSPEIYRFNLELGRYMSSLKTDATELLCSQFNPVNNLFSCGTIEGHVECWDPRSRNRVGILDCALNSFMQETELDGVPSVTSVKYRDGLTMAVGTSKGQVLLYDLRSDKPLLMKDHNFGLPIKSIEFHDGQDLVLSSDSRILKLWDRNTGKSFTAIESEDNLNDLCLLPNTGMLLMANDAPKLQIHYIPALGPAPKWCSFLDNLTEELEENPAPTVYDDYKFVSRAELESLGLSHLIGSKLLKAYMHGFFIDVRLYRKSKSIAEPFAYEDYRKDKIREKIEEERTSRIKLQSLPKVNKHLAEKILERAEEDTKSTRRAKKSTANLMQDDRFSKMFSDSDFQVDMDSSEYRLINPVLSNIDKVHQKKKAKEQSRQETAEEEGSDIEGRPSEEEDSSDDEHSWAKEVKAQHRQLKREQRLRRKQEQLETQLEPKFVEMKSGAGVKSLTDNKVSEGKKLAKRSFGERLQKGDLGAFKKTGISSGNMEMSFTLKKSDHDRKHRVESDMHHKERRKIRRSAGDITKQNRHKSKSWSGHR